MSDLIRFDKYFAFIVKYVVKNICLKMKKHVN